jgi:hypothetical protein
VIIQTEARSFFIDFSNLRQGILERVSRLQRHIASRGRF